MSPKRYLFEFHVCTALKVSGIFHDIIRNQSEDEAGIPQGLNKMGTVFVMFAQYFSQMLVILWPIWAQINRICI